MEENLQQVVSEDCTQCDADDVVDHDDEETAGSGHNFVVENGWLFKLWAGKKVRLAAFHLTVDSQKLRKDEGHVKGRMLDLTLHREGKPSYHPVGRGISVGPAQEEDPRSGWSRAILYGSLKDLRIATQELSVFPFRRRRLRHRSVSRRMEVISPGTC